MMGNFNDKLIKLFLFSTIIGVAVSYSKVYLFHVVLVFIMIYALFIIFRRDASFNINLLQIKELLIWLFIFLFSLGSIFWSLDQRIAIQNIFYLFCGISILIITVTYISSYGRLFQVIPIIGISFFLNMFFGLLETVSPFRLPISPYSNYLDFFGREGTKMFLYNEEVKKYVTSMPTGFNWNPNDFSVAMIIFLPFLLFSKNKLISITGSLTIFYLIIQAGSRTNFIAFIIVVSLFLFLKYRKVFLGSIIILILTLTLIGGFSSLEIENKKIGEALGSFQDLKSLLSTKQEGDDSIGVRQKLMIAGIQSVKETKGFGVGIGNSIYIANLYNIKDTPYSLHNFWLQILVEIGLIGFIVIMIWYIWMIVKLYLNARNERDDKIKSFTLATCLAMIGFFIGSISMGGAIYFLTMWLLFGMAISLINLYKLNEGR